MTRDLFVRLFVRLLIPFHCYVSAQSSLRVRFNVARRMLALRHRLLFVAASLLALQLGSSPSSAQQYSYPGDGGGGGGYEHEYYSHEQYADGHRNPDDLYANYAASHANAGRRGGLHVDLVASNRGSAIKLALAFSGGFVGAKVHSFLKTRRSSPPKLRFKAGQRVLCHMGNDQWARGSIVKLWPQQGKGTYSPYSIRLDDLGATSTSSSRSNAKKGNKGGQIIYAPADHDGVIRAAQ